MTVPLRYNRLVLTAHPKHACAECEADEEMVALVPDMKVGREKTEGSPRLKAPG
jgi:hypothetical protein